MRGRGVTGEYLKSKNLTKVDQVEMKAVQGLDVILFQQVAHLHRNTISTYQYRLQITAQSLFKLPGAVRQKETQAGPVLLTAVGTHVNPVVSKIRITQVF